VIFANSLTLGVAAVRLRIGPVSFERTTGASNDQLTLILGSCANLSCSATV